MSQIWKFGTIGIACLVMLRKVLIRKEKITTPGRKVMVTGAASGLGRSVALLLALKGWRVYACDVNQKGLKEANFPSNVSTIVCDVRNVNSCEQFVAEVLKDGDDLDALVNVAAVLQSCPALGVSEEEMKFIFEVNTWGPMRLCKLAMPLLLKAKDPATIVNVSSIGGKIGWPWTGMYSSSKAALDMFSTNLRRELKASNLPVRVSVVSPGGIKTAMAEASLDKMKQWCLLNGSSPFHSAIDKEATFQRSMAEKGYALDLIALDPMEIAEDIENILNHPNPSATYISSSFSFYLIYFLAKYLPTPLADRFIMML